MGIEDEIMGYESPIGLMVEDIENKIIGEVVKCTQNMRIYVNRTELLKALAYDRGQYDKGYRDGFASGKEEGYAEALEKIRQIIGGGSTDE